MLNIIHMTKTADKLPGLCTPKSTCGGEGSMFAESKKLLLQYKYGSDNDVLYTYKVGTLVRIDGELGGFPSDGSQLAEPYAWLELEQLEG